MYKCVLLKLSGEALSSKTETFDINVLDDLARQINILTSEGCKVGVVVGGGNIVRGRLFENLGLDRVKSDYMGMLATVVNALSLEAAINKHGGKAVAMSAIEAESVMKLDVEKANELLDQGYVVIFGGGIGKPYFSTDTASAKRAAEISAEVILMAKNGVDGVYDSDPNKNPNAVRFDCLSFDDILKLNLQVIDSAAASLCLENGIEGFVFDMAGKDNIVKAARKEAVGTLLVCK